MKKIMVASCALLLGFVASAECTWSWWMENKDADVRGASLGLATENRQVAGAQISLIMSKVEKQTSGCQWAIGYSRATDLWNGVQMAFFNNANHAALQFGLICRNEGGFLPWFVFFNFDKTHFGAVK